MVGTRLQRRRQPDDLPRRTVEAENVGDDRLARGQGSGLVEGDGGDAREGLKDRAALDQETLSGACGKRRGDRRRRRDDQGAGAADEEDRQPLVDPPRPFGSQEQRRRRRDEDGSHHDARRIVPREAVDEAFGRSLALLCLLDQPDHAGDRVVGRGGGGADAYDAIAVDGPGVDGRARPFRHGLALARHRRLVYAPFAVDDDAVGGDAVARADEDHAAYRNERGRHFTDAAVLVKDRGLRDEHIQGADARSRLPRGNAFEKFADQEQEYDGGTFLPGTDDGRADGRDRHQRLDGEWRAGPCGGDRAACDRQQTHEHRCIEGVSGDPWLDSGGDQRRQEGDTGGEGRASLGASPPRKRNWTLFHRGTVMVVAEMVHHVFLRSIKRSGRWRSSDGVGTGGETQTLDLPLDRDGIHGIVVADGHRRAGDGYGHVQHAWNAPDRGVDLAGASPAVHAADLEAGLRCNVAHVRPLRSDARRYIL